MIQDTHTPCILMLVIVLRNLSVMYETDVLKKKRKEKRRREKREKRKQKTERRKRKRRWKIGV